MGGVGADFPQGLGCTLSGDLVEKNLNALLCHLKHYFPVKTCVEGYEAEGAPGWLSGCIVSLLIAGS